MHANRNHGATANPYQQQELHLDLVRQHRKQYVEWNPSMSREPSYFSRKIWLLRLAHNVGSG